MAYATFDSGAQAIYIYLSSKPAAIRETLVVPGSANMVNADFNSEGQMVGLEVLGIKAVVQGELPLVEESDGEKGK